ncbi:replication factor A protein 2 [Steccherinum ochraceum]|uniref:Replication factor A protein 2 n=1 Tax=Steccherinum ochraceum TaxID=92696 RepID=A0A4R0RIC4_9APHY|nr:replication factor A protein 2 [Steccherinum ochraceum]
MSQYENPYYQSNSMGGGYMSGGGSQFNSPGAGTGSRRNTSNSLRPLTVKQVYAATQAHTDAEWMLDDLEVGQITVVAQVMSVQKQATNSVYYLDDGTGRIEARHWIDTTMEDDEDPNMITDNSYVRVLGGIKSFGNKRYINASHVRVAKDPSETYYHVLDVVASKLLLERGAPGRGGPVGDVKPNISAGGSGSASAYTAQSHGGASDQYSHLPQLERSIITFMMNQPPNEEGIHVGAIARTVGGSANEISAALDKLMDEGHVFTTLDESHYALSV